MLFQTNQDISVWGLYASFKMSFSTVFRKKTMRFNIALFVLFAFLYAGLSFGQIREYRIHSRGMLHETVFNTGEIGRAWMYGPAGDVTAVPLMEWPPNSSTSFGTTKYSGQENSIGGGRSEE